MVFFYDFIIINVTNTILLQGLEGIGKYTFVLHLINSLMNNKNTDNLETS